MLKLWFLRNVPINWPLSLSEETRGDRGRMVRDDIDGGRKSSSFVDLAGSFTIGNQYCLLFLMSGINPDIFA